MKGKVIDELVLDGYAIGNVNSVIKSVCGLLRCQDDMPRECSL